MGVRFGKSSLLEIGEVEAASCGTYIAHASSLNSYDPDASLM